MQRHEVGRVAIAPLHQIPGDNHNARLPDIAFTSAERALPIVKQGGVPQMPDLAIEIKSPNDRVREVREKADYYLRNGARAVWLVYPDSQSMEVCTLNPEDAMQIAPSQPTQPYRAGMFYRVFRWQSATSSRFPERIYTTQFADPLHF